MRRMSQKQKAGHAVKTKRRNKSRMRWRLGNKRYLRAKSHRIPTGPRTFKRSRWVKVRKLGGARRQINNKQFES